MLGSAQRETVRSGRSSTPLAQGAWVPARTLAQMIWVMVLLCATAVSTTATDAATAGAASGLEHLQVPSAAMGRDIPVAFLAGGPHAVYLLDAFDAGPDESNWITAGNAVGAVAGKGVSLVAPAGGAYTLYTDWERDGSKQWSTFLSTELPDWLAANRGLAPGGHAIVGASQGGTAALTLAESYPNRFRYAGSMSGFLYPSTTSLNGALHEGMMRYGGVDTDNMWGPAQLGRWKWHDPYVHLPALIDNQTRLWIFSPQSVTASDPAAMVGYADQAQGSSRDFLAQFRQAGGRNGHFDFPVSGDHGWSTWAPQLSAMSSDMAASIR
jgi:S-formylglutathione hydrolase FrmB